MFTARVAVVRRRMSFFGIFFFLTRSPTRFLKRKQTATVRLVEETYAEGMRGKKLVGRDRGIDVREIESSGSRRPEWADHK